MRRIPLVATLVVLAAVAVMVRLGLWQLDRMHQKDALLELYTRQQGISHDVPLMEGKAAREQTWFRHTSFECLADGKTRLMAGHNSKGETGWAHWGQCLRADGRPWVEVNLGWSKTPLAIQFSGGTMRGMIAPDGPSGARVVADQPLLGLEPSARPDPNTIPNNHWSYAIQWFLFAATALVVYALALRKRLRGQ
jgi:surfeit locus 1 family protein